MPFRPTLLIIATLIAVLLISCSASVALTCQDFPISKLRLLSTQPRGTDEYLITRGEMDRIAAEIGVSATERAVHPLMLMTAEIDTHIAVQNRIIEIGNGKGPAYCDAPTSVAVAFGVVKRNVFLLREAAAEPCVRHALLEHYAEHSRALDREVELFIHQRREDLGMRLRELKQTAATDRVSANRAFEAGLWSRLREFLKEFKQERVRARPKIDQEIDSVERLNKLRDACAGRVHEMEQKLPFLKATTSALR
jgi:hypothetical protein